MKNCYKSITKYKNPIEKIENTIEKLGLNLKDINKEFI